MRQLAEAILSQLNFQRRSKYHLVEVLNAFKAEFNRMIFVVGRYHMNNDRF